MSNIPPWELLGFTFGTEPDPLTSVPRCSNVTVHYYGDIGDRVANPPPTAPYSIVVYSGGSQRLLIPLDNNATRGDYMWQMNLPEGQTYGVSMRDSSGYSGGILSPHLKVVSSANCDVASPLQPANLDVTVSGSLQCGQAIVDVRNGTAPYKVEMVPSDNRQQKTIHFASSPFSVTLDMSKGVQYFLSISDSAGHSSVQGVYTVEASSDVSCLSAASTISAGMYSTLYPGGTAIPSVTASSRLSSGSNKLASGAVIAITVTVSVVVAAIMIFLLGLRYKRNRRKNAAEKLDLDLDEPEEHGTQLGYNLFPTPYFEPGHGASSYYHSSVGGPLYSSAAGNRNMIANEGATSYSGTGVSAKRA